MTSDYFNIWQQNDAFHFFTPTIHLFIMCCSHPISGELLCVKAPTPDTFLSALRPLMPSSITITSDGGEVEEQEQEQKQKQKQEQEQDSFRALNVRVVSVKSFLKSGRSNTGENGRSETAK